MILDNLMQKLRRRLCAVLYCMTGQEFVIPLTFAVSLGIDVNTVL